MIASIFSIKLLENNFIYFLIDDTYRHLVEYS